MPSLAAHTPESLAMASNENVQQAISFYLGFGRKIPPQILDKKTAEDLFGMIQKEPPAKVAARFRAEPGDKYRRALLRAVHHNLWLMRQKTGRLPWER